MDIGFIFMATRHDRTVAEAGKHIAEALAAGVRHIGFKNVGLPLADLRDLARQVRAGGATMHLEVVSADLTSEIASVEAALTLGVDWLLGGTHPESVLPLLASSGIHYAPFVGRVSGHPNVLEGDVEAIAAEARRLSALAGVAGLDLLAYRHTGQAGAALIRAVVAASSKPVIVAGSLDSPRRIADTLRAGAAGFTVGTAALDNVFAAERPGLAGQLDSIRNAAACIVA